MARDVIVVVQRDALPSEKESLDILLVSTTGEYPVGTYRDVESVKAVYGPEGRCPNAKVVRKATTLLNQGKTTLATSLVSKFKIVSFNPATQSVATAAKVVCTFSGEVNIAAQKSLWFRFGGDDEAVVKITTSKAITSAAELAALFNDTNFVKDGKTYSAADTAAAVVSKAVVSKAVVSEAAVTFTATTEGEADTIPEIVDVFTDEQLTKPVTTEFTTPAVEFTNGKNAKSAAENFIEQIKKFQSEVDNDWYYLLADKDDDEYVIALAKFAEASEPSEAELGAGVEDHRKFYMGQTSNKAFVCNTARAAVIYADEAHLNEEPDASYTGNVGPFYPHKRDVEV